MEKKKLLYAALSGAASIAFALAPVMAASAVNDTTGPESTNEAKVELENEVSILQENNLCVSNNIQVNANTGYNKANKNTGSGSVSTGDANVGVSVSTSGNSNSLELAVNGSGDYYAGNETTGPESENEAKVEVENEVDVTQENNASVSNNVGIDADTGHNKAEKNTGDGSVQTGDVDVEVSVVNDLNENVLEIDGLGSGDPSAVNDTTGPESENEAKVEIENDIEVLQENNLSVSNNVEVDADTGHNKANKNTGDGSVDTGDVEVDVVIENSGNSNEATIEAGVEGEFEASNETTGPQSENEAKVEVENEVDVTQLNNSGVSNHGVIEADTGHNKAEKNTGDGEVDTGDSDVEVEISTDVNSNVLD